MSFLSSGAISRALGHRASRPGVLGRAGVACALAGTLVAGCAATSATSAAPPKAGGPFSYSGKITISPALAVPPEMVPFITQQAGLFKKEGLTNVSVNIVGETSISNAIGSDTVQFGVVGSPTFDLAAVNGEPITVLSAFGNHVYTYLVADSQVKTLKDLKGKTIAVGSKSSESTIFVLNSMLKAGLKISDAKYAAIPGGTAAAIAAFEKGEVAAVDLSPPNPAQVEAATPGSHIVDSYSRLTWPNAEIAGNTNFVKSHPEVTEHVLKALNLGLQYWRSHPAQAEQIIEKMTGETEPSQLKYSWQQSISGFTKKLQPVPYSEEAFVLSSLRLAGYPQAKASLAKKIDDPKYAQQAIPNSGG